AHTAVQLGAGPVSSSPFAALGPAGPPRDNSASSSLLQGLTTTAALLAAHTGLSAASPPSHPMLTTPLAADGDAVGASGGTVFPTDDALGHFSGASMPGFPLGSSASPSPQHGAVHSLSGVDPRLLLGYDPEGTVGDIVQLPCQTTMNKVAASQYVELWHFTVEGIAAGFRKSTTISDVGRRLMDQYHSLARTAPSRGAHQGAPLRQNSR
ncbi:unnamed protein product, partial [Tilletia controversa]